MPENGTSHIQDKKQTKTQLPDDPLLPTKANSCGKSICPEDTDETTEGQQEMLKDTVKKCVALDKGAGDTILYKTLEKLKIRKQSRSGVSEVINKMIESIVKHLRQTAYFKDVQPPRRTGSYYEKLKVTHVPLFIFYTVVFCALRFLILMNLM